MKALLEVRNLSIGIRRKQKLYSAVEDISFEIYPGEILGIVGESGSGKTLTALSIPALLNKNKEVTGGEIIFRGTGIEQNLLAMSEKELRAIRGKEISIVFQEAFSSLNPLEKIGAQIAEVLELHGEKNKTQNRKRVLDIMKKLVLDDAEKIAQTYPHRLSGGMCQRVMIAIAIICGPRLIIADEPTTALDKDTEAQIITLLKNINRESGTSILFISHDLEVIKNLCGRVLVIYSGRIVEEGSTADIFENPAHEYTKGLLGSVPRGKERETELVYIPGKVPSLEEGRPAGCPFHPRCGKARPECAEEFPRARNAGANHKTRCVLYGEEQEEK